MRRTTLATCAVAVLVVLAGCGGTTADGTLTENVETTAPGSEQTPTDESTPSDPPADETPPDDDQTPSNGSVDYESVVFDHWDTGAPAIEGGIAYPENLSQSPTYYATMVTSADRFNRSVLSDEARTFLEETNFSTSTIVAVQTYPASSHPDYRVESITESKGRLDVAINDSSKGGTADLTVETLLIRVDHDGDAPAAAQITTEDGVTFGTGDGKVVVRPDREETDTDIELPYRNANLTDNVADPRDLYIDNDGTETNGYNVTVVADTTHRVDVDSNRTVVFGRTGKLRPGGSVIFKDLLAGYGEYELIVEADLPTEDGGRETITKRYTWRVSSSYHDAFVTIDDDGVDITQSVE